MVTKALLLCARLLIRMAIPIFTLQHHAAKGTTFPGSRMNHRNLLAILLAFVALTASSVVVTTPSEASHGTDHYVYARITARLAADGQVEFALQQRLASNTWGARIFPRARYFPTTATVDQWLVSSTLTLSALDGPSSETDVRITARLRDNGQVEFALQQLVDGTWDAHIFPRARYFPTGATVGQWLVSSTLGAALPRSAADADRAVIEAFYRSTGGQGWTVQTNWLSSRPLNEWHGVTTNSNGRVARLYLDGNNLSGSIPPELGNLAALEILSLGANNLTGSIPPELGNLAALEILSLGANNLTGSIPPELGDLTNLRELWLADNSLSGSIPPELGSLAALEVLSLGASNLTGSIPPELGDLTNLRELWLANNRLTGSIPPELGNFANLWFLHLHDNNLSGSIPPELGDLTNLALLHLHDNNLSGSIPPELGDLTDLRELWLADNNLSGSIPPELGDLTKLEWLYLHNNSLSGSIPPELGNLSKLDVLSLSHNQLSGSIPPELGNLSSLHYLWLHNNNLSGSIPPDVAAWMTDLAALALGDNDFTGPVPPDRIAPSAR